MKIANSDISFHSRSNKLEYTKKSQALNIQIRQATQKRAATAPPILPTEDEDRLDLTKTLTDNNEKNGVDSGQGKRANLSGTGTFTGLNTIGTPRLDSPTYSKDYTLIKALHSMIESLTGRKMKFVPLDEALEKIGNSGDGGGNINLSQGQGWPAGADMEISVSSSDTFERYEKESMSFSAEGMVQTQDGKQISISLELNMNREFYEKTEIFNRITASNSVDPLVINFDAPAAKLTQTKFAFDLDSDGKTEMISHLMKGSGFLALDKNNDGAINNGNELFSPKSGDGFKDLAEFDDDQNGWIDENDSIYDKLRIWTREEDGSNRLLALGAAGIGAIYLGRASTNFSIKTETNQTLGQVRQTGIFLREQGGSGSIQHVDLEL